uniref:NADH-ubiquinone oxidoreductase chain 2 n=1 Tax=Chaetopterus qiani TaxID=3230731 RepID=A0AB39A606_9ANNE
MLNTFPFQSFFIINLIASTFFVMSSQSWLSVWCGLEYNLISFIPILMTSPSTKSTEAAIKYFIVQALASIILLLSSMIMKFNVSIYMQLFILLSLMVKMGVAPFHQWVPNVISSISWGNLFLMLSWQKLAPIFVFAYSIQPYFSTTLMSLAALSSVTGGVGGMNQSQIRPLIAFSSIGHMGWILTAALISPFILFIYFSIYMINLFPLVTVLNSLSSTSLTSSMNFMKLKFSNAVTLILLFFSLGGLPPLLGFMPKLLVINSLVSSFSFFLLTALVVGSLLNIYYYFSFSIV